MRSNTVFNRLLIGLVLVMMFIVSYMIFVFAPTEATMGDVQRIFYFHVSVAWIGFLAFFVVLIASILYLVRRERKWDIIAAASAEIGVVFTTLMLISGPLWAKPVWGVWWTWEPRLTTALILWIIYVSYLLVRNYASDRERGSRFAAVIGIVGFFDVPIVFLSITWWRTQHPSAVIFESGGLTTSMLATLLVSVATFTVLYIVLLLRGIALKHSEEELEKIKESLE